MSPRLATLLAPALLSAPAMAAPPPVVRAVLHPDGAIVTRRAEATCADGNARVPFAGLPPVFDPATLRASTQAPAQVQGVSVSSHVLDEPYSDEVRALDAQLEKLQAREASLRRELQSADAMDARADTLRTKAFPLMARESGTSARPNTAAWTDALDTARKQQESASQRRRTAQKALRDLVEQREDLQRKRDRLAGAAPRETFDADVVVSCAGGKVSVELSYATPLASWSPAYEARAEESAVGLGVLANARQRTGEAWNNIELALSTSLTTRDARPPTMQKLVVGAYEQKEQKKVLVRRDEAQQHVNEGAAPGAESGGEVAAADQGLSVQLAVPGRPDLAGDGTPARLRLETISAPVKLGLVTIPKLAPFAFRAAEVTNSAKYPLLAGPVDLFTANGFIGTAALPRTDRNDRARLSFGVDETIKIKRVVLAEDRVDAGFFSSGKRLVYGYRIELVSSAKGPVQLLVQEPVPVSEIDDVKLKIDDKTTPGFTHAAADGRVDWNVTLQPKERKVIELHFGVEVPSRYESSGL